MTSAPGASTHFSPRSRNHCIRLISSVMSAIASTPAEDCLVPYGRVPHDRLLACPFDGKLPGEPAFGHDHDAIAHAKDLGKLRRDHDDGLPLPDQLIHQRVDLALCPDVDSA